VGVVVATETSGGIEVIWWPIWNIALKFSSTGTRVSEKRLPAYSELGRKKIIFHARFSRLWQEPILKNNSDSSIRRCAFYINRALKSAAQIYTLYLVGYLFFLYCSSLLRDEHNVSAPKNTLEPGLMDQSNRWACAQPDLSLALLRIWLYIANATK